MGISLEINALPIALAALAVLHGVAVALYGNGGVVQCVFAVL